jgi:type III pantothenate kinase
MVRRFQQELGGKMKVIATGGLADIVAHETDVIQVVAPWLTLDGLQMVWEMNHTVE